MIQNFTTCLHFRLPISVLAVLVIYDGQGSLSLQQN